MFSLPTSVFDRLAILSRLPSSVDGDSDWGGDQADSFATVESDIPCRLELTDIDLWTVWMSSTFSPQSADRISVTAPKNGIVVDLLLEVVRSKPWTRLDGSVHHHEIVAKEVFETRSWADGE